MNQEAAGGTRTLGEAAVEYALAGRKVFPLWGIEDGACLCGDADCKSPGKHPLQKLVPHGLTDASDDPDVVDRWWTEYPAANIGLATGGDLVVVDLDGQDAAARFYSHAKDQGWDLSGKLAWADTGRGAHLYFAKDPEVTVRNQQALLLGDGERMDGVDIRGDGGYVVAPPSVHRNGRHYSWNQDLDQVGPPPPGLLQLVAREAASSAPEGAPRIHERQVDPAVAMQVESALEAIPPNQTRQDWIQRVSMPVHDLFGGSEEGFQLWHNWCRRAEGQLTPSGNPAYRGEADCRKEWNSFQAMHRNPKGIATLFQHARDLGWKPPASTNGHPQPAVPGTVWQDPPEDIWAVAGGPGLDLDALLERLPTFAAYVRSVARLQQVPVEFPFLMALGMAAGACGNAYDVALDGTSWREPMALWIMCALESGAGKSPVLKVLSAPMREWEREWLAEHEKGALPAWRAKVEAAQARLDAARRELRSKKASRDPMAQGQLEQDLQDATTELALLDATRPQARTVLASNLTTPALVEFMQRHQDRCLILDSEGGTFQHALSGRSAVERDLDPWLKAFSGDPIKQHRIGNGDPRDRGGVERYVESPCLSIAVATQVDAMDALKDEWAAAKGLLPRFVHVAFPYALPATAVVDGEVPAEQASWWRDRIRAMLDTAVTGEPRRIYLADDSGQEFRTQLQRWLDGAKVDVEADRDSVSGYGTPTGAKLRSVAMRVAGILHILENPKDPHHREVPPDLVRAVMEHFIPFAGTSIEGSTAAMRDDPDRKVAERLLRHISRNVVAKGEQSFSRGAAARNMRAKNSGPGQVRKANDLNQALSILVDAGWIVPVDDPKPRGPGTVAASRRYDVHPRFTQHYGTAPRA